MHNILERQIKKYLKDQSLITEDWAELFDAISLTYQHFDEDRAFMDRSLELSTGELNEINEQLRNKIDLEKDSKKELETQRLAILNILEDVSESQSTLKHTYKELKEKSEELTALKDLGNDLASALDIDEVIIVAMRYLNKFFTFSTVSFLITNPSEEGGVVYTTCLNREVSERYINTIEKDMLNFLGKNQQKELLAAKKIIETVKPKVLGKKLNNQATIKPSELIYQPLRVGDKYLGLIQSSQTGNRLIKREEEGLMQAINTATALSIDRLQTLILTQHSKTLSLVQSLRDGVVMFNANQELVLMNPAFSHHTGFSSDFFSMENFYRLMVKVDFKQAVEEALRQGKTTHIKEVTLLKYSYEAFITPVRDNKEQIVGGAIILHDITYLKEIDKMKTEFVSVASHQLRTPLTAIKLFTDMMLKGQVGMLDKEQREYLENILESTERMVRLVNDLLNVTRIESGRLRVEPQLIDINEFMNSIMTEATPLAKARRQKLDFIPCDEKLPLIPLDQNLIRQVIHNLIVNAIRYSPESTGKIEAVIRKEDKKHILISVKDNGIGIPLDSQKRIFEKFYRADNAIKAITEGTGLGLYVSRMIVEQSGGKIWFGSNPGKGTEFFVRIPITGMAKKEGERSLVIS